MRDSNAASERPSPRVLRGGAPAGSASARARVKSPESRIAFPLTALLARLQGELDPLHRGTAQAERHEVPTAPTFHTATRVFRRRATCLIALSQVLPKHPTAQTIFDAIDSQTCCPIDWLLESFETLFPSSPQLALRIAIRLDPALASQVLRWPQPSAVHTTVPAPLRTGSPQTSPCPVPQSLLVEFLSIALPGRAHTNSIDTGSLP